MSTEQTLEDLRITELDIKCVDCTANFELDEVEKAIEHASDSANCDDWEDGWFEE